MTALMEELSAGSNSSLVGWGLFLVALAVELVAAWMTRRIKGKECTPQEEELRHSIRQLKKQADKLNTPDTFAKSAKLLREAAVKEKTLAQVRPHGDGWFLGSQTIISKTGAPFLRVVVRAVAFLLYRNTAIIVLPQSIVQPFGWLLSWPHETSWQGGGAVAIIPWLTMSLLVSSHLVSLCFPSTPETTKKLIETT